MDFSDEILMAYADEELEPAQRAAIEQAMAGDPEIARRVAAHRALRERIRGAYEPVLREAIPGRLLEPLRERSADRDNVIPLRRGARPLGRSASRWTALAASLLLGAVIALFADRLGGVGPFATRDGRLLARGALATALNRQLASSQGPQAPVQIGVSYRAKDGEYCRTFTLRNGAALAGLACHDAQGWRMQMLVQAPAERAAGAQYRRAASPLPSAILQAVEAGISGEPLDAREEARARSNGWRP